MINAIAQLEVRSARYSRRGCVLTLTAIVLIGVSAFFSRSTGIGISSSGTMWPKEVTLPPGFNPSTARLNWMFTLRAVGFPFAFVELHDHELVLSDGLKTQDVSGDESLIRFLTRGVRIDARVTPRDQSPSPAESLAVGTRWHQVLPAGIIAGVLFLSGSVAAIIAVWCFWHWWKSNWWIRRLEGRKCARCAYPLPDYGARCPECGQDSDGEAEMLGSPRP